MTKNYNLSLTLKETQFDLMTQQSQFGNTQSLQKGGFSSMYNLQSTMREESRKDQTLR